MSTGEAPARLALECRLEQGVVVATVTTEALPPGSGAGVWAGPGFCGWVDVSPLIDRPSRV
jgi:hypothetical protein